MTYLAQRMQRRSKRPMVRQAAGLGDLFDSAISAVDFVFGMADPPGEAIAATAAAAFKATNDAQQQACIATANASTGNLDAIWQQISQQWLPSGNFTAVDLNTASSAVYQMIEEAKIAVIMSPNTVSDRDTMVNQAVDDLTRSENQGITYQQAIQQAQAANVQYITANGFKDWVLYSLTAASNAFATRTVMDCNQTWLATALQYLTKVRDIVMAIVTAVADAAVAAGEAVVTAAATAFTLAKYLPWIAAGLGGIWLYKKYYAK